MFKLILNLIISIKFDVKIKIQFPLAYYSLLFTFYQLPYTIYQPPTLPIPKGLQGIKLQAILANRKLNKKVMVGSYKKLLVGFFNHILYPTEGLLSFMQPPRPIIYTRRLLLPLRRKQYELCLSKSEGEI